MAKVLLTGATGFLGGHLLSQLLADGHQVRALYRNEASRQALAGLPVEWVAGDICDLPSLSHALREGADWLFHVAGDTASWQPRFAAQWRINVEGTRNVVHAAREARVGRLIHTSSVAVYGLTDTLIDETAPLLGRDGPVHYAHSKAVAEEAVREGMARGLDAVICQPTHIFGPGDRDTWARLILLVDQGRLPGVPPGRGAFIDVRQAARAHIAAAERGRRGEAYLLGGEEASFLDLVRLIGGQLAKPVPEATVPAALLKPLAWVKDRIGRLRGREPDMTPESVAFVCQQMRVDCSKAVRELGLEITPLPQLLMDTIAWLRKQGLVAPA